jgi:glucose-6-phosphate 1-dehydrogenase
LTIKDWHKDVIRGQYEGYQKPILPENTQTETFVALRLHSSLPAWEGVPFFIKTGKALKHKKSSAMVSFHSPEGSQIEFPLNSLTTPMITSSPKPDFLKEKVSGTFLEKGEIMPAPRVLTDSASLIFECLLDKKEHFVSLTEIKASWQLIDTIREHFKEIPLESYEKGSEGPSALRHFLPSWKK